MPGNSRNQAYIDHVRRLEQRVECKDEAMRLAVGGEFDAVGKLEYYLLRSLGLRSGHLVSSMSVAAAGEWGGSWRATRAFATLELMSSRDCLRRPGLPQGEMIGNSVWLKVSGSRVRTMWPIFVTFFSVLTREESFQFSRRQRAA